MKKIPFLAFCTAFANVFADQLIWFGDVDAKGEPTSKVDLTLDKTYQIKVSGTVNLGKWQQQGKPLNEDANYDFNDEVTPSKNEILKNSLDISVGDGKYHPDHVYESKPFVAINNGIHFWIKDIDYSDNSGKLQVQIIEK